MKNMNKLINTCVYRVVYILHGRDSFIEMNILLNENSFHYSEFYNLLFISKCAGASDLTTGHTQRAESTN